MKAKKTKTITDEHKVRYLAVPLSVKAVRISFTVTLSFVNRTIARVTVTMLFKQLTERI